MILACALTLFPLSHATATTFLSGELPATLTAANNPYIALSTLTLTGHECVIEAGVEINFTTNTGIDLRQAASLVVAGTSESPVVFRGWNEAQWRGIQNIGGHTVAVSADWLVMERAYEGFYFEGAQNIVLLRDSTISGFGAAQRGMFVQGSSQPFDITIQRVHVTGITSGTGIHIQSNAEALVQSSSVTEGSRGFEFNGFITGEDLSASGNTDIGFVLYSNQLVLSGCFAMNNLGDGIYIGGGPTPASISSAVVTGNSNGIRISYPMVVNNCTIHDNVEYDVFIQTPLVPFTTIDMRNNYWGPATTQEMHAEGTFSDIEKIYDWWNNSNVSLVDYEGFTNPTSVGEDFNIQSWGSIKALYR